MKGVVLTETPRRIFGKRTALLDIILSQELGERYIEYRKQWVKVSKREFVSEFPLYLQIENLGRCNLRCPICVQGIGSLRKAYSYGLEPLNINLYKKILKEAQEYRCPSIALHNNDEPLLLKDLVKRIYLAREVGFIDIILTTNATLLNRERTHELLNSGITKINFSVDTFEEKKYSRMRIGGEFSTIVKNIDYFCSQKEKKGLKLPITRVTCVLTKFTVKDMEAFRNFWKDRVDAVEFQNFQAIKGYTEDLKPSNSSPDKYFFCNAPWQQLVIRPNGDVLPCCTFYGIEMVIGNIKNDTLHNLWHSNKMKEIRKELLKNNFNFSKACSKCSKTSYIL